MPDRHIASRGKRDRKRTEWSFHPLADIFPMMDEAALAELAADIKAESQREPIYSGTIAAPSDGGSIPSD
jgi:hypothetical protein